MAQTVSSPGAADTRELREAGCGRAVGRYTLLRRIAAGGMAEVYSARSTSGVGFAKRVAIKKILPQYSHNERFISMLVDEAKITVSLDHPSIAQVYELGHDGEDYFIVMEYVDGRPLNKLMQRVDERGMGVIPVEHACHVMSQVAVGLHHAHGQIDAQGQSRNIVHRDVSPQNILVSYEGPVKLIDFGIARAEGRLNQTSAGVIKGKLRYLAPEIAAGMEPDHRADVFCCGIVLFEMLTGEAMFAPKSDLEAIELATLAKVKSPRARNRRVPQELDDIVMKALKRDREDRYPDAHALYAELRRFLNQAYPAFVDSDLGDFMQDMFAVEMREDRHLDEVAERVATSLAEADLEEEDPTMATGPIAGLTTASVGYRQLVTRVAIDGQDGKVRLVGADGGAAMDVVPADRDARPLIQPGSLDDPGTLPPEHGPGAIGSELTVKAQNPFVADVPSGLPTITGPAPLGPNDTAPPPRAATVTDEDALVRPLKTAEAIDPSLLPTGDGLRLDRAKWPLLVGGGAFFLSLIVAAILLSGGDPEGPSPVTPANAPIELDPISIGEAVGQLVLNVSPQVPVSVTVEGTKLADRQMPPITLDRVPAGPARDITLSADGFRSITISRAVKRGESLALNLELVAATGSIEFEGLKSDYRVHSSVGELQGDRVIGIPPNSEVHLRVTRPGTRSFRKTVRITEPRPVRVVIPEPKSRPHGTLVVNTRPMSTVYVDGKKRGRTPLKIRLPAGRHRLRLKGPNNREYKATRMVRAGRVTRFQFRW